MDAQELGISFGITDAVFFIQAQNHSLMKPFKSKICNNGHDKTLKGGFKYSQSLIAS